MLDEYKKIGFSAHESLFVFFFTFFFDSTDFEKAVYTINEEQIFSFDSGHKVESTLFLFEKKIVTLILRDSQFSRMLIFSELSFIIKSGV